MTTNDTAPLLVSEKEAARLLGISLRTVRRLIARKELRAIRVGRRSLISRQALEQFTRRDHALDTA